MLCLLLDLEAEVLGEAEDHLVGGTGIQALLDHRREVVEVGVLDAAVPHAVDDLADEHVFRHWQFTPNL